MKKIHILLLLSIYIAASCTKQVTDKQGRKTVLLETNKGNITLVLYDQTPLHRDNFIKLVNKKFFDGTIFHRVIDNFMVQGGDPDSKNAKAGDFLGNGGPGYTIPAEIQKGIYHKKGALASARLGDDMNPERASSGSQFYIVEGTIFSDAELDAMEEQKKTQLQKKLAEEYQKKNKEKLEELNNIRSKKKRQVAIEQFTKEQEEIVNKIVEKERFRYTADERETYKTIGGTPHLDGGYTVFGEVIDGLDIVLQIAETPTDKRDRPKEDIVIKKAVVIQ